MEFLRSSKISHADGLSRLMHSEHVEDTEITSLLTEIAVKIYYATLFIELPLTVGEIKEKAFDDDFIKEIKNKIKY